MREFLIPILIVAFFSTACSSCTENNAKKNHSHLTDSLINTFEQTDSIPTKILTFTGTTSDYFVEIIIQFKDTTLTDFALIGNCKNNCQFSFSGRPKFIGKAENVSLPAGTSYISTSYFFTNDNYAFGFKLSSGNNPKIRLMLIKIHGEPNCDECTEDILTSSLELQMSTEERGKK